MKTLPGLHELISGDVNLAGQIRPVQVEDVLGREQVEVDLDAIAAYVARRRPCSSPARAARSAPSSAARSRGSARRGSILVDQGESALFEIERELVDERGFPAAIPVLADCGNRAKMRQRLRALPAGRRLPRRGVQARADAGGEPARGGANNVLATRVIAEVAVEFGVERFVLISTDKAANPNNLLGQSKAVCEWIVESFGARERRRHALRRGALRQRARLVRQR